MGARGLLALSAGFLLFARPAAADADGLEPSALNWVRAEGAASCPSAREIARAVERRLDGAALVRAAQAELLVEALVAPLEGGGFRVTMSLSRQGDAAGTRELETREPECRDISDKAALAIALMIDPEASVGEESADRPSAPEAPPPPSSVPSPAPRSASVPAPPPRAAIAPKPDGEAEVRGELELAFGIMAGQMPRLAPGVFLRGRVGPSALPLALELEGGYFPPKEVEAEPGKGGEFEHFLAGIGLSYAPWRTRRLSSSASIGFEVGSIAGRGYGFDYSPKFQSWTYAVTARARLGFLPAERLTVLVGPDLAIPLKRDHFQTETPGGTVDLFRVSAVALGFEIGAAWEF